MGQLLHSPFFWLLVATFFKQILWLGLVPLWHFPDEQAHFAQLQNTTEIGLGHRTETSNEIVTSEKYLGVYRDFSGRNAYTFHPEYNLTYTSTYTGQYEDQLKQLSKEDRTDIWLPEATSYPFLYYWVGGGFYRLVYNSDLIDRVFMTRVFSVLLFVLTVGASVLVGRIIFKKERWALGLGVLVAFQPMFSFVGAAINSDVLFNFWFSLFILGVVKISNADSKSRKIWPWLAIMASISLGFLTKQQMLIAVIILAVWVPFLIDWKKIWALKTSVLPTVALTLMAVTILAFTIYFGELYRVVGYITAGQENNHISLGDHLKWTIVHTYREVLPWYWGVFKWLGVTLPRWVNRVQMSILLVSAMGIIIWISKLGYAYGIWHLVSSIWKNKSLAQGLNTLQLPFRKDKPVLFLLFSCLIYFLSVTLWDWQFRKAYGFSFGVQGRYFFPTLVAHMGLILVGIKHLIAGINTVQSKFHPVEGIARFWSIVSRQWLGVLIFWWVILHTIAVWTVANAYYDLSSWQTFIVQASQYKPWLFKGEWWGIWIVTAGVSQLVFLYYFVRNLLAAHSTTDKPLTTYQLTID